MLDWPTAVLEAVKRCASLSENGVFTRQALINNELERIVNETKSIGLTPEQTLSRELQELADAGKIVFVNNRGTYRYISDTAVRNARQLAARYDIDGFRSLRNFSITLEKGINVLVGPNGAGKTNFIDFIDFLSALLMHDASAAVSVSGGVSRVFSLENSKKSSPKISARVSGVGDISTAWTDPKERYFFKFEYYLEVRFSKSLSAIYISTEKIKFFALHNSDEEVFSDRLIGTILVRRRSPSSEIEPSIEISPKLMTTGVRNPLRFLRRSVPRDSSPRLLRPSSEFALSSPPGPAESMLAARPIRPAMEAIRLAVSRGRAFNIIPSKAREPDEITRAPYIEPDGSGLSATLYHMQQMKNSASTQYDYRFRRLGKETLDAVIEWTKVVIPELQDISAVSDPHSGKYIVFLTVGKEDRSLKLPLQAASDGTIKWLSFVSMILVQGGSYSVEEPENYLHPKMQQFLVHLIRETVEERNGLDYFIMSTHSESIINQLRPDELILFEFKDGSTHCRRLDNPESVEAEINRTGFGLGYFYASNAIS